MNKLILLVVVLCSIMLSSCTTGSKADDTEVLYQCPMKCEGEKTYNEAITCPVCKMDLREVEHHSRVEADAGDISSASIFNLTSTWTTQNNKTIELQELKGDVLVIVMIYTSCKAACPRLVADMRSLYQKVNDQTIKYILVSIDPKNDTPERLKEFAIENQMDNDQWILLRGKEDDVRELSNVLAVKYKQVSPLDFSHSNIISVFDQQGVLHYQQEGLGVNNATTVTKINELLKQ